MTSASRSLARRERCSVSRSWLSPSIWTPSSPISSCLPARSKLSSSSPTHSPAAFSSSPHGLAHTTLGIGLAILAAGLLGLVQKVDFPRWQHERDDPLAWRVGHAVPGSLLGTLAVIAALAMITNGIGGLYWLGGAMAVATSAGLINSWVLLVEIKR